MRKILPKPGGPTSPANIEAYSLLTFRTALANISAIDKTRPLSGSSPSDGNETAEHPYSWDHQSEFYGDVHCYLYDSDNWDFTSYKRPRFMSEFGLQSWPSAMTMSSVFPTPQWDYDSDLSTDRNHHADGQDQMLQQISMHFHLPKPCKASDNCTVNGIYTAWSQMLWMTQINQALGYKNEIEHFRRIRTECTEDIPGCNMGQMFWQTNDIWQGASWAAIDFTGRYKMVQYYANKFYSPFHAAAFGTAVHGKFSAYIINDWTRAGKHVDGVLKFTMHSWATGPVGSWNTPFNSLPATALEVYNSSWSDMLSAGNCSDATECFLILEAFNGTVETGEILSSNYLFLAPFTDVTTMVDPNIQVMDVEKMSAPPPDATSIEVPFKVTISSDGPAAFVWLETPLHGRWSDNGFLIPSAQQQDLIFYSDLTMNGNISASNLHSTLKNGRWLKPGEGGVWSLTDTSQEYSTGVHYPSLKK